MKIYSFVCVALVISIGLESLYSSALEMPWEYEFPFKLPFASHDVIHRTFPIRVKYTKEVKQPEIASIRREWPTSDPATNNESKDDKKQPETPEPKDEMTNKPSERMDKKDISNEIITLKNSNTNRQEAIAATHDLTSSDASSELDKTKPAQDKDSNEGDSKVYNSEEDNSEEDNSEEDNSEEDNSEEDNSGEDSEGEEDEVDAETGYEGLQEKTEAHIQTEIPLFPYRLIIQIMNPKGQIYHKMKTGYVSQLQARLFKKDNIFYFLRSLRNKHSRKVERKDSEDYKKNEKQDEISHPESISAPVIRLSSQAMDKKGNLYRQDKMMHFPAPLAKFLAKKYKDDVLKSIGFAREVKATTFSEKDDEESKGKSITVNEKTPGPKSADDTVNSDNEALPSRKSYWQEKPQKKEPFKVSNSNSKIRYVYHQSESRLESSVAKADDEVEKEKLKKIVIIRPVPRVFHASLDIIPPEKAEDAAKKMEPTVMSDDSQKLPLNNGSAAKYVLISGQTKFSLNHILDPLKRLLNIKFLARPGVVEGER